MALTLTRASWRGFGIQSAVVPSGLTELNMWKDTQTREEHKREAENSWLDVS